MLFGLFHCLNWFVRACCKCSSAAKYLLCVVVFLVSFHTLSILFRWGLYGGRNSNRILSSIFSAHSLSSLDL